MKEMSIERLLEHRGWVRTLALWLVKNESEAEDIVQETWLAALEQPPEDGSGPRSWLYRVVQNLARKSGRNRSRRRDREDRYTPPGEVPSTDELVQQAATQKRVVELVLGLPDTYRGVLLLRFFEGLPPRRIAESLDLPVETVRTRIKRGLARLREGLEDGADSIPRSSLILLAGAGLTARPALASTPVLATSSLGSALGAIIMSTTAKITVSAALAVGATLAFLHFSADAGDELEESSAPAELSRPEAGQARRIVEAPPEPDARPTENPATEAQKKSTAAVTPVRVDDATCVLAGRVRDDRGDPLSGVAIYLDDPEKRSALSSVLSLMQALSRSVAIKAQPDAVTDESGAFRLEGIDSGSRLSLAAVDPERGAALKVGLELSLDRSPLDVDLVIERGVVVRGKITDTSGQALPGINVTVNRFEKDSSTSTSTLSTDAKGHYRSFPLPFRTIGLQVWSQSHYDADVHRIEVPDGKFEHVHDFELEKAPVLRGNLVTADGRPARLGEMIAARAGEELMRRPLGWRAALFADYRHPDLNPNYLSLGHHRGKLDHAASTYEFIPRGTGFRFLSVWVGRSMVGVVELENLEKGPDIVIDPEKLPRPTPTSRLHLEVVDDASGSGLEACTIRHGASLGPNGFPSSMTRSPLEAENGIFILASVDPGLNDLIVEAPGYAKHFEQVECAIGVNELRIRLRPAQGRLVGRVQDLEGKPVNGAQLLLLRPDGRPALPAAEMMWKSNAEGRFEIGGLASDDYLIVVSHSDYAGTVGTARASSAPKPLQLVVDPGRIVRIYPDGASGPFSIRIVDDQDRPIFDDGFHSRRRFGQGFKIRVPSGRYRAEISVPKFETAIVTFDAEEGLRLEPKMVRIDD